MTTPAIDLTSIVLRKGQHARREDGVCAMEAVAWLAGEAHSGYPKCACPVVSEAVRALGYRIDDDETRTKLLVPLLPRLVGSRTTSDEVMRRRAYVAADWAVRVFAPIALRADEREVEAARLEACRPIVDRVTASASASAGAVAASTSASASIAYAAYAASCAAAAASYAYAATSAAASGAAAAYAAAYAAYAAAAAASYAYAATSAAAAASAARRGVYARCAEMIEAMLAVA